MIQDPKEFSSDTILGQYQSLNEIDWSKQREEEPGEDIPIEESDAWDFQDNERFD
jgi:hypothetical protein